MMRAKAQMVVLAAVMAFSAPAAEDGSGVSKAPAKGNVAMNDDVAKYTYS
jgi:hypothetical protein